MQSFDVIVKVLDSLLYQKKYPKLRIFALQKIYCDWSLKILFVKELNYQ